MKEISTVDNCFLFLPLIINSPEIILLSFLVEHGRMAGVHLAPAIESKLPCVLSGSHNCLLPYLSQCQLGTLYKLSLIHN